MLTTPFWYRSLCLRVESFGVASREVCGTLALVCREDAF